MRGRWQHDVLHLCSILDGFSRYIVNWDVREAMTEADIEIILQGAKELYPEARPRIIVRTSPFYPQSNGKIERWHKSLKAECIRRGPVKFRIARDTTRHESAATMSEPHQFIDNDPITD